MPVYTYDISNDSIIKDGSTPVAQLDVYENKKLRHMLRSGLSFSYDETTKTVTFTSGGRRAPRSVQLLDPPDIEGQLVAQLGWTQQRAINFVKIIRKIVSQELK